MSDESKRRVDELYVHPFAPASITSGTDLEYASVENMTDEQIEALRQLIIMRTIADRARCTVAQVAWMLDHSDGRPMPG